MLSNYTIFGEVLRTLSQAMTFRPLFFFFFFLPLFIISPQTKKKREGGLSFFRTGWF